MLLSYFTHPRVVLCHFLSSVAHNIRLLEYDSHGFDAASFSIKYRGCSAQVSFCSLRKKVKWVWINMLVNFA